MYRIIILAIETTVVTIAALTTGKIFNDFCSEYEPVKAPTYKGNKYSKRRK